MTIKAIMLDVDGVLIVHPDERGWAAELERDLGIPVPVLQGAFFTPHWADVIHGRAALRERLAPVLAQIAPQVGCDQLIDYWFGRDAHVNEALLDEVASIRADGIAVHLATVQEHERARFLWNSLGFRRRFDGLHYAADLGHAKPAAGFFTRIEQRVGLAPRELLLVDDQPANVDGARACGWKAAMWTGEESLRSLLTAASRLER